MARDYAAEYARRVEIAHERGFSGTDVVKAARGHETRSGLTSDVLRDLERNPAGSPVRVISYRDKDGQDRIVVVTHNAGGRAKVHTIPAKDTAAAIAMIEEVAEDHEIEVY